MYNQFLATRPKARRQKDDSPATAGAGGKLPRVGVNKSDLEAQGAQNGWTVGPVTPEQVKAMSSAALRWHEQFNAENLDKALTTEQNRAAKQKDQAADTVRKKWLKQAPVTDDEQKQMRDVATQFLRLYPQFIESEANVDAVWNYMQEQNLDPTELSSPVAAFESLAQAGKVSLNPSAISAGPERSVSGRELTSHHSFHLLLQPQRRTSDVDKLSADQFKAAHPELHDTRMPFIVSVRKEREANTTAHKTVTQEVTSSSGSTKVVDYPQEQHGVPPQPEKVSFRKKVNSMTADQIQQECAINPAFRKSLDEME